MDDEHLEKALNFIRDKSRLYAKAKANRVYLMEFRKSKKAILMKIAQADGYNTTAAQEREAYAHDDYLELLQGIKSAVEQEELFRYQMKAAELKVDVWRSKESSRRSERSRYGA